MSRHKGATQDGTQSRKKQPHANNYSYHLPINLRGGIVIRTQDEHKRLVKSRFSLKHVGDLHVKWIFPPHLDRAHPSSLLMPHRETSSRVCGHKLRDRDIHHRKTKQSTCFGQHAMPTATSTWGGKQNYGSQPAHHTIYSKEKKKREKKKRDLRRKKRQHEQEKKKKTP